MSRKNTTGFFAAFSYLYNLEVLQTMRAQRIVGSEHGVSHSFSFLPVCLKLRWLSDRLWAAPPAGRVRLRSLTSMMTPCVLPWALVGVFLMIALTGMARRATAAPPGLSTEDVSFRSGDVTLHGTIWAPVGATHPLPGLVLVHGSGPGPRAAYQLEAETFARAGIVTVAYDKRMVGYSFFQRSYAQLAADALAAVELLRSNPKVDQTRVGLWGESEGAWVVPLAASRSTDVAFVILVGASGVSPARQQSWYLGNLLRHYGVSGSMLTAIPITSIRLEVGANLFPEADFDGVPALEHLHQPVLAVWSRRDYDHPPEEASHILQQALDRAGNRHYTIRFFADSDPGLHFSTDGVSRLDGLAPGYADLVASWVGAVAAGHPPGTFVESAPHQDRQSQALAPLAWYESGAAELIAIIVLVLAFAGYPVVAVARRISGRGGASAGGWPARLVSTAGLIMILVFPVYLFVAPLLLPSRLMIVGRPLPWLAFQALAVIVVVSTVVTALRWWRRSGAISRGERMRLGLLLVGGVVFGVWAIYWGLLIP
jgi:dienelactone hydrolase